MRKATKVIAISESIYDKYLPILGKKKLVTILNGVDPDDYYMPEHELFQGLKVQLLIVGGIKEGKGQRTAIAACLKLLKNGISNYKLRIVGKGNEDYVSSLMDIVKKSGAEDYIEFCGPSDDTAKYYQSSDIMLMCSRSEAFGRVTVEAMFAGALVIGGDTAGTKELIQNGETGLLYESGDSSALAGQILYAANHKSEMQQIARKGQRYLLDHMTAEINAENINKLYESVKISTDVKNAEN